MSDFALIITNRCSPAQTTLPAPGAARCARWIPGAVLLFVFGCLLTFPPCGSADTPPPKDDFWQRLHVPKDPEPILGEILARKEFRTSTARTFIQRVRDLVAVLIRRSAEWLDERWRKVRLPTPDYDPVFTVLGGALLTVLMIGLVVLVARAVWLILERKTTPEKTPPALGAELGAEMVKSRAEAIRLAQQGNYRDALIKLFHYVLYRLDQRGVLRLHPCKTNHEILSGFPRNDPVRTIVSDMIRLFNAVRYGSAACGKGDFERFLALADQAGGGD